MHSALYTGSVWHRRRADVSHAFRYPLLLFRLALDELDALSQCGLQPLFGVERAALFSFRRRDHLPERPGALDDAVRGLVAERTGLRPQGPVDLLTLPRAFGTSFNPVSFYYCWDPSRRALEAVVAEVTNTPWGERHAYVLPAAQAQVRGRVHRWRAPKVFHVSPFLPMELVYDFAFGLPGERLGAAIHCRDASGAVAFEASLALERRPLGRRALAGASLRSAFQATRVLGAIYFEALRLRLRGAPFHPHPQPARAPLESLR